MVLPRCVSWDTGIHFFLLSTYSKIVLLYKVPEIVLLVYFQGKKNATRPQRISGFLDRSITLQVSPFPNKKWP